MPFSEICKPRYLEQSHSDCSVFVLKFRFFFGKVLHSNIAKVYAQNIDRVAHKVLLCRRLADSHIVADLGPCVRCPHTSATYVILQIRKPVSHRCLSFLPDPLFPFPLLPRHTRGHGMSPLPHCPVCRRVFFTL